MSMKQKGFFDEDDRLKRLTELGDPLQKLEGHIDWEIFRPTLKKAFKKETQNLKKAGGRPPFDYLMMFKILNLQEWYNIADDQTEFQINDRLSFQRFLSMRLNDKVPDAKTIWLFREHLKEKGTAEKLFKIFRERLEDEGVITRRGSIVDATFVDVPKQRNTREENKAIKEGNIPENWKEDKKIKSCEKSDTREEKAKRNKVRQKDVDARWAKKNEETHYGYKDNVKVDADSKIIVESKVTAASVHDSQALPDLIDKKDEVLYADSAYSGEELEKEILKKNPKLEMKINEKGYRNNPLTKQQQKENRKKSKTRARVEHVFGYMTSSMGGIFIRCIGMMRAECKIQLKNLAYNLRRSVYLQRLEAVV
jgi:IS5 family transposase